MANPLCVGCRHGASVVDRRDPHRGDPAVFWDRGRWQAMCARPRAAGQSAHASRRLDLARTASLAVRGLHRQGPCRSPPRRCAPAPDGDRSALRGRLRSRLAEPRRGVDDRADWREAWALFPGDVAYVWHAAIHATTVAESLIASGFDIRAQIVWSKPRFVLGRGDYHWQHEPCRYAVRKGAPGHWQGARDQSTLWAIASMGAEDAATTHGTQKPVEAMRRPMVNNSARGEAIYEPFAGSGTALIAAETVGRTCLAMELDPAYCDVAVARWEAFAGRRAERTRPGPTQPID
jgi:hypothetical protein